MLFLGVGCSMILKLETTIWPSQEKVFIWFGCLWAGITYIVSTLNKIMDAFGRL